MTEGMNGATTTETASPPVQVEVAHPLHLIALSVYNLNKCIAPTRPMPVEVYRLFYLN